MASQIIDEEFGTISIRRSPRSSSIRLRVAPDGTLRASLPLYAPLFLVKKLVKNSRQQLRKLLAEHQKDITTFTPGMQIGKSHSLIVRESRHFSVKRHGQHIVVQLPVDYSLNDPHVIHEIREVMRQALRKEAKSYLPKRLSFIANKNNFTYQKVRFSHAGGRWGSCSSSGTISLNIALMKLSFELIDYVLIHELSHTIEMNHSDAFWRLVAAADPAYQAHRHALKNETPSI